MFDKLKSILWWNSPRNIFMKVIESHLGRFYLWAGDDPSGFDCSGLAVEGLQSIGYIKDDCTADGLWQLFRSKAVEKASRGCLVFYFDIHNKATHVGVAINRTLYITADGGGSSTLTIQDAINQNAFVKIRPIDGRTARRRFVNLF